MSSEYRHDTWSAGQSYDHYMGRWSRLIAAEFVPWLSPPTSADWVEIGCGTGALTETVLRSCAPRSVLAIDRSADFVAHASAAIHDPRARFEVADAQRLPLGDRSVDVVVSALVMNFVPDKVAALMEMRRVLRSNGVLSFYVWDYPSGGVGFIDAFWKAAAALDPDARELDERIRFPFCTREGLAGLCRDAGLKSVDIVPIEVATDFPDFEAFWHPFTLGAGPAPGYCMNLLEEDRARLKARLAQEVGSDGPVQLSARAWAVKGAIPA